MANLEQSIIDKWNEKFPEKPANSYADINQDSVAFGIFSEEYQKEISDFINSLPVRDAIEVKPYYQMSDEIGLTRKVSDFPRMKISSSRDADKYARQFYYEDISIYESFFVIALNNSNQTIGFMKVSQGGITGTLVDVRIVLKIAVDTLATGLILVHNHPSGTLRPSESDKQLTKKIKLATELFDCKVLDHLIITEGGYYSFADENIL